MNEGRGQKISGHRETSMSIFTFPRGEMVFGRLKDVEDTTGTSKEASRAMADRVTLDIFISTN